MAGNEEEDRKSLHVDPTWTAYLFSQRGCGYME
jgi:hypothetical protein